MRILFVMAVWLGAGLLITALLAEGLSNWRTNDRAGDSQVARAVAPDTSPWQPVQKEIAP